MSIILKGIDMPKNGEMHRINIYDNGNTYITTSNILYETDRKDVEAIQIDRPHGRLGDLDKVLKGLEADTREAFTRHDVWLMLSKYNINAPTILEAEE